MAGPEGGEGHGGGVAAEEAAGGGAARGGARGAAAGGIREGTSPLSNARGTSWSPSSRTFPVAAGRGRGGVAAAKGGTPVVADEHNNGNSNNGASVTTDFKQTVQTGSTGSAPAAGVAVDGGPMRGKRATGSPSLRKAAPGSEDDTLISSRVTAAAQQLEWAATASSPDPAAEAAAPGAPQQPPAGGAPSRTQELPCPTQEDFALEVNGCFQKMYSGVYSVDLVVSLLQRLAQAPLGGRDSSLFLAMLRTLFFECRHFPRYPTQELLLTAELFGKLIASQVLLHQPGTTSSNGTPNPSSLVIALRCVLEALRKGPNSKMFLFGVAALEQVLPRLYLFPEFLVSLSCLPPHFNLQCPHYTAYIENLLLLIPKPLHACVCLDPAAAATALPPIPEPPATRGPGATNLTPAIVAPPPGIVSAAGTSQQLQQQQGLPSHAPTPITPTAATSTTCLQTNKAASPAAPGLKPGEGGGERGAAAAGGGGLEQRRRQQLQATGLLQQQHGPVKGPRPGGGAAGPSDVSLGGPTMLGSEAANPGEPGGVMLLGGTGPRPFFAAGAAAVGVPAAGEQSGGCPGGGQRQLQQEQGTLSSGSGATAAATAALLQQQQQVTGGGDPNNLVLAGGGLTTPPAAIGALLQGVGLGQVEGLMNDRELLAKLVLPPQWLAEQVIAACNSVCEANVEDKAAALRHVLAPEHQAWLAFYLVKSRASKEPNLHAIFFLFIEKLEMSGLPEVVVNMSYDCINTLFKYLVEAKESSSYRTLLKNLGLWLGRITLGRNRPLMSKRLDLKALLFRGYDEGHLVAVLPLVCKVLEGVKLSKVFKPPNPWTTAMLSLLAELQQLSNLRTNLIFEVEVLFKHLHINVQDYHGRSHHLARRPVPASSPDFVIRAAVSSVDPTACPPLPTAAASNIKPLGAALSLPGAAAGASSLLAAGPPPGIVVPPTAALGSAAVAAAAQQQPTAAAPSPPPTSTSGQFRSAAAAVHARPGGAAASSRGPAVTTPERSAGSAIAAADGGVGTGAVCSRLLLAAAAGNAAAAQKLQQQQRGPTATGAQLLETHQAGGSRLSIDAVTAGLRTAVAAGGGPGAAGSLQQQQLLSQQQQLLAQRQQFPQLQSQGGAPAEAAASDGAGLRGSGPRVTAEETLLQHHQRLLAAASAAGGNGGAGDAVSGSAEDAEGLAAGRRDPRSLLLAAAMRGGAAAGEASSLFLSTGSAAAGAYAQQQTAADRSPFLSSASYGGEPQGSPPPPPWPSLPEEQQGVAEAATAGAAGGSASLLTLLQQQVGGGGGGATLLEQQQQVGEGGGGGAAAGSGPPPPPTQKTSPAGAAAQLHQAAAQGSPYRTAAAGVVAGGGGGSGLIEGAAAGGGGASPPSLFGGSSAAAEAFAAGVGSSTLMPSDTLLQSLAQNVIISPSIALLSLQPGLRPLVPLAVERAVREIISAVAERSVTISCVTTRELVCKDFCMEGEESLIKRAAHLMVASLAGSLALITCREPLRVSLTQNLRQLLQPVASTPECGDQVLVEQVLQIVSTDNLDLGCSVIEQAVVEKVLRDIEVSIQPALLLRRQAKERGVAFVDTQYVNSSRWPAALPEPLKLHPLLNTRQLQVYKDFMLIGPLRKMHQQHLYGTQQLQQRSGGQQQIVGGAHGLGGVVGVAAAGSGASAVAGTGAARDSAEGAAAFGLFGAAGTSSLPLSGAAAAARLPGVASQQQHREAIQQMAATVAAARVLNQQQQKLMQLQQQGMPSSGQAADSADSTRQQAFGAAMLGPAAGGVSPQQQRGTPQSSYAGGAAAAPLQQHHSQLSHYSGQEQSLSVLMLRLEGCLVQLRDIVRDIFNSPPVMPTPSTAHRFSHPAGCQMHALPVPLCSTSALLVFACLPSNHELFQLIASVSSVASSCSRMDEVAPALAHKLIKSVFEGAALAAHRGAVGTALRGVDPTGLYMEVFFAVLAALRRESEVVGKLAGEVLSISCASATLPPKRSNVAVAAGLMRYGLIDFSAFDGVLANHLEGGRNAPVVEFVLVLLKVLQDQHAVSPAALPSTFKTLAAADSLPQRSVQLRGWESLSLTEAKDKLLKAFQEREAFEKKEQGGGYTTTLTQLMEEYCMPAYPVKVRCLAELPEVSAEDQELARQIFEDWIRLCTAPGSVSSSSSGAAVVGGTGFAWMTPGMPQQLPAAQATNLFAHRRSVGSPEPVAAAIGGGGQQQQQWGEESALLLRAMFFQKVSQQGLLRMDEDTDRFFAVCVEVAIEKATVMLRSQASAKDSSRKQQQIKEGPSSSPAEAAARVCVATDCRTDTARVSSTSTAPEGKDRRSAQQQQQEHIESQSRAEEGEGTASGAADNETAAGEGSSSQGQRNTDSSSPSSSSSRAGANQKTAGIWSAAAGDKKDDLEGENAADNPRDVKREDKDQEQQQDVSKQQEAVKPEEGEDEEKQQQQQQSPYVLAVDPTTSAEALAAMETPPEETEAPLEPLPLDAFAKMISAMMRFVDPQQVSPVLILQRALGVVCRHMHMEAETLGSHFNQRPYFRLLLSILLEVTSAAAFPLLAASGGAAAGSGTVAAAAGATAGGSQQSGSSSETENAPAGLGISSPSGGGGEGVAADSAAVAAQQVLLQQSIFSFADHLALLCPLRLPAFAFAWLELVGHRMFLPLLLRGPGGMRGNPRSGWVALHKLLLLHFEFIHPFLASVSLSDSVRQLYKGTLRVLLVLLHDFPEYLCETYVDCCSVLPLNCVQLRNVILSAFPRNMRLPDPFLPNLRIELLPEVKVVPRLLLTHSFYSVLLLHQRQQQHLLKSDVDLYWQTRDAALLPRIRKKLLLSSKAEALKRGTKYDVPLFNAFLLYVATSVPEHDPRSTGSVSSAVLPPGPLPPTGDSSCSSSSLAAGERGGAAPGNGHHPATTTDPSNNPYGCRSHSLYRENNTNSSPEGGGTVLSPALEIILYLAKELDMEGRYLLMSAIANHLRYPNAHTHFFSTLLLWLFSESKEELVQEQITRVLLERLIVHRPHPWGLLITFIELIKNPKFAFWSCLFVSAAPEVEKLFQSVAHTCLGQSGAQQLQQQRQR